MILRCAAWREEEADAKAGLAGVGSGMLLGDDDHGCGL
jgi:hypothetical protein